MLPIQRDGALSSLKLFCEGYRTGGAVLAEQAEARVRATG
jgi:hypothetical protein